MSVAVGTLVIVKLPLLSMLVLTARAAPVDRDIAVVVALVSVPPDGRAILPVMVPPPGMLPPLRPRPPPPPPQPGCRRVNTTARRAAVRKRAPPNSAGRMEPNFGAFLLDITCFLDPGCEWLPIRPCDKVRGVIIAPGIFENREPSKPDFLHSCLIGQEIAAGGVDYELPVFIDGLNGDLRSGAGLVGGTSSFQSGGAYGFRSPEMPSCLHLAGYGGGSRRVGQRGWPVGGFDGDIGEHQGSVVLRLFGLERGGVGKSGPSRSAR